MFNEEEQELKLVMYGRPYTKKNDQIIADYWHKGKKRKRIINGKNFQKYELDCKRQITGKYQKNLSGRYNLKAVYYMPTKHIVDLVGLLQGTCDILTNAGVIKDDNSRIISMLDGSEVKLDRENPRVEITLTRLKEQDLWQGKK